MEKIKIKDQIDRLEEYEMDVDLWDFSHYSAQSYICDIINELADSNIDIYTSDLLNWACGNYSYIDDAICEYGKPDEFIDYIKQGQYYYYTSYLQDNIADYLLYYSLNYLLSQNIEELTSEQYNQLLELIDDADNNNTLEDLQIWIDESILQE